MKALSRKKTYLAGIGAVLTALGPALTNMDPSQVNMELLFIGLSTIFLRQGVAKSGPEAAKPEGGP